MRNLEKSNLLQTRMEVENLDIELLALDVSSTESVEQCVNQIIERDSPADKTEEQAKKLAEQFARAYLVDRKIDEVMKMVALPHLFGWSDSSGVLDNADRLKASYEFAMKSSDYKLAGGKDALEVLEARTYETFLKKETRNFNLANIAVLHSALKKSDQIVHVRVKFDDATIKHIDMDVMVREMDGKPQVVGFLHASTSR